MIRSSRGRFSCERRGGGATGFKAFGGWRGGAEKNNVVVLFKKIVLKRLFTGAVNPRPERLYATLLQEMGEVLQEMGEVLQEMGEVLQEMGEMPENTPKLVFSKK